MYKDEIHELFLKRTTWKQRRSILSSQKELLLIKTILIICLEMEQFVLVPLSVYNSSNNPTIVTKQELPKYKPDQNPTYHKDTLKKGINKQLSTSASPLLNRVLESPRIKLSNSSILILDGIETGVLLKDFIQRLKLKKYMYPIFTLLYLTQPASLPTSLSAVMPRVGKEELGSLSKTERQKLQRLCMQGFAVSSSVRNLAKAAKLSSSKVREFLHSKTSYTKFTQATRKFKRMRAFARFKGETWRMDIAYFDKLAKDKKGVKYLLVRHDLSDRTVDEKGMKTKESKEKVKTFSKLITKKNRPKKWVDQGTEFAGKFKNFCSAEGIEVYSTMSETKAAFAERRIRSLKNICIPTWRITCTIIIIKYLNLLQQ